jgi:hypothetical protein
VNLDDEANGQVFPVNYTILFDGELLDEWCCQSEAVSYQFQNEGEYQLTARFFNKARQYVKEMDKNKPKGLKECNFFKLTFFVNYSQTNILPTIHLKCT